MKEFEYLEEEHKEKQPENVEIDEEMLERFMEMTRAELLRKIMEPDIKKALVLRDRFPLFTKELKVGNLNEYQLFLVVELTDLANQCASIGAENFAKELITYRDAILSASPSLRGMFLRLTSTNIQVLREERSPAKRFFSRGE